MEFIDKINDILIIKMITFLSLLCFWLLLANSFQLIDFMYAIVCISISLYIRKKFFRNQQVEIKKFNIFSLKFFLYLIWLMGEMIKASIAVLKMAYCNQKTSPNLTVVQSINSNNHENLILAHSITFTPGTITIAMQDNQLIVHSLTTDLAESLKNDPNLYRKITNL